MSFWKIMNLATWALSVAIFLWLAVDFIKTEKQLAKKAKKSN